MSGIALVVWPLDALWILMVLGGVVISYVKQWDAGTDARAADRG